MLVDLVDRDCEEQKLLVESLKVENVIGLVPVSFVDHTIRYLSNFHSGYGFVCLDLISLGD
jgi:hypothetical protein